MSEQRNEPSIRPATPRDVEPVVRIYVESWNVGFGPLMPPIEADAGRVERWRRDLGSPPPARWWVAEESGRIAGFVGIRPSRDPVDPTLGEIDTIAVAPAVWRKGVGSRLMSAALDGLRADGYRLALLWTLDRYPLGASFYAAMGWRLHGATRSDGTQVRYDHAL